MKYKIIRLCLYSLAFPKDKHKYAIKRGDRTISSYLTLREAVILRDKLNQEVG